MNYIEVWASRDEIEPYNNVIFISQKEPEYILGKWHRSPDQVIFSIGVNDTDVYIEKGIKTKVKLLLEHI